MLFIVVTLPVLKSTALASEKSSEVRLEQLRNMEAMLVTLEVLRYSKSSIVVSAVIPANHLKQVVGRAFSKDESNTTFFTDVALAFHPGVLVPVFRSYFVPVRVALLLS